MTSRCHYHRHHYSNHLRGVSLHSKPALLLVPWDASGTSEAVKNLTESRNSEIRCRSSSNPGGLCSTLLFSEGGRRSESRGIPGKPQQWSDFTAFSPSPGEEKIFQRSPGHEPRVDPSRDPRGGPALVRRSQRRYIGSHVHEWCLCVRRRRRRRRRGSPNERKAEAQGIEFFSVDFSFSFISKKYETPY